MAEQRPPTAPAPPAPGRWAPPPALSGFLVLLVVVFAASYGVGSAAGPVAPGMHSPGVGTGPGADGSGGTGGMGGTHSGGGR
ncbi:hypothetical protein ACFWUW_31225 [Streptomyces sp. NPDC058655]|uniref:hypothetical protein n=1 Tax=unclassified Streptomyces TaxID=2593676 RepID=UPI00364C3B43